MLFRSSEVTNPGNGRSFRLTPKEPFTFKEKEIGVVIIRGDNVLNLFKRGELQVGKKVIISDIDLEKYGISIIDDDYKVKESKLKITNDSLIDFQIISFYPEVKQKNTELDQEEKGFLDLLAELTGIIDKNNQEVVPQAQELGLKLPLIPSQTLEYFFLKTFLRSWMINCLLPIPLIKILLPRTK